MASAIAMARRGLGTTWPNPSVGCIIVKDGRVLGRGKTQPGGRPHAERMALAQAGDAARGATAYVTLEPCSHQGASPPCTDALIEAGIKRVVMAQSDPDPRVSGERVLRSAGIEVITGVGSPAAQDINIGFTTKITQNRPYICLKIATTLDGKIATKTGESRWITGPEARRRVHMLRATYDGVLIGRGTAEADDPMLDVRGLGPLNAPVRIVMDSQLKTRPDARLVTTAQELPSWFIHAKGAVNDALSDAGCRLIEAEGLDDAMARLAEIGLTRILCEGGAQLSASLMQAGLVDELVVFSAGKVIGADGVGAVAPLALDQLEKAPQFDLIRCQAVGPDIMSVWRSKS